MNTNCLSTRESMDSPLLHERARGLGRNFIITVLAFAALCVVSYLLHGF